MSELLKVCADCYFYDKRSGRDEAVCTHQNSRHIVSGKPLECKYMRERSFFDSPVSDRSQLHPRICGVGAKYFKAIPEKEKLYNA
jgi:hypothetical protein